MSGSSEGPATDASNDPVVDPTKNVLDLVDAAVDRLNDLREMESRLVAAEQRRQDDLRKQEATNIREILTLRAEYAKELRDSESERIDAIRAVDVQAVAAAAQAAEARAGTLAAQVASSAEAMRTQVTAAATAASVALAAALDPIQKSIDDLRRAQYEAQGQKTQVVETRSAAEDLRPHLDQIQSLLLAQATSQGSRAQIVETRTDQRGGVGMMVGVAGAMIGLLSLITTIIIVFTR